MMRKIFILSLLLITMLLVFGCQSSTTTSPTTTASPTTPVVGNKVGDLAPNFQLQDLGDNTVSLSGFNGSPVIINFWRTT
jgi:cytochrome oxidase Cu insertion factor (SCO1/SenC/PrrC family)